MWKNSYITKAAMGYALVCIATILPWLCISGQHTPTQSPAIIPLSNLVTVPAEQDTCSAVANHENSQIATVPETPVLNTGIKNSLSRWHTVRMRVTAYSSCPLCCGPLADGRTANGHVILRGDYFVAAPKKYPFGTEIVVPQYNRAKPIKVLDRGGAIKGNCLDLFFHSYTRAVKWGVKYIDVKVKTVSQIN
jgi:3D (Asp-Asp-Asp) domain-containing protein